MSDALSKKAELLVQYKKKKDIAETNLKLASEAYQNTADELKIMLENIGIDSFKAHGFTFYIEHKESVKNPETLEDKMLLFDYLRANNMFNENVSVHSATLNSLYKSLAEKALKDGILEFRMPGILPPTSYRNLKLRKVSEKK